MTPHTVLVCVDVCSEDAFHTTVAGLKAWCNSILCQGTPLPMVGLSCLFKAPSAPKPQVQVKRRPTPLALRDFHTAAGKLLRSTSADGISGADAAAAAQSLAELLLQDKTLKGSARSIALITDRLYPAEDFATFLQLYKEKGISLVLLALAPCDQPAEVAAAGTWQQAQADSGGFLAVEVVQLAGTLGIDLLARALLQTCCPSPPVRVNLVFNAPLMGSVKALSLHARCDVLSLCRSMEHRPLCPCHALLATYLGEQAPADGFSSGISAAFACPVTGDVLPSHRLVPDGKIVQIGPHAGGILHLDMALSMASSPGACSASGTPLTLTVRQRVPLDGTISALLVGPPLTLSTPPPPPTPPKDAKPGSHGEDTGAFSCIAEGQLLTVNPGQVLAALAQGLQDRGQGLLCTAPGDLATGASSLFQSFYVVSPATGAQQGSAHTLKAMRVACQEELAPPPRGSTCCDEVLPPPAVVEAVQARLDALQLAALNPTLCVARLHHHINMLVSTSKPLPKMRPPPPPKAHAAADLPDAAPSAPPFAKQQQASARGRGAKALAGASGSKRGGGAKTLGKQVKK